MEFINLSEKTQKSITSLQDLADLAGVSRATASRALNDSPLLNKKTKERLRKLAEKHNYSINRRASDFRLRRTRVISVVFMLDLRSDQHMSDPFFLDMLGSIADSLAEHDYDLLLTHAPMRNVLDLKESRVMRNSDGVIFIGQGEQHEKLNELAKGKTPIVVWGYPIAGKNYVVVGSENLNGGYQSTRHLLGLQHRKIAFFGNTGNPENAARHEGYLQALSQFEVEADADLKVDIPFEMKSAREAIIKFMASKKSFDAVVCASDVMALASISTFQELGLRVPQDVAVVGFDDIRLAAYSNPPLTTVRQNIQEAGRVLVESVLAMIKGEDVTDTILPSELIVRKSSGK
ncbi:MAG: LacI family DNA-binding transcriptional regulator [Xanthomonadales bacterium]|nr:LacI family DNA-binding transcriptional regulator [Xanthomonadales bacterium]